MVCHPRPDFICKAFKAAHEANPKIELFYNDYKIAPASGILEGTGPSRIGCSKWLSNSKKMGVRSMELASKIIWTLLSQIPILRGSEKMLQGMQNLVSRFILQRLMSDATTFLATKHAICPTLGLKKNWRDKLKSTARFFKSALMNPYAKISNHGASPTAELSCQTVRTLSHSTRI